jgi:hypothetical protein
MAFDISALEQVVMQSSRELATKAVSQAVTAKLLINNKAVTPGVKGKARINKMDADVSFQDGSGCSARNPTGNTVLTEAYVTVQPIKDTQNFCPQSLYDTYYATLIAQGQDPATENVDAAFISQVMDYRALKVASQVENLLWQGDTALTGANNLKYIDGLLKQITAASDKVAITITGATTIAKLQSAYSQMPIAVRKQDDFRIFIGQDTYDAYLIELDGLNKFRVESQMTLTGTSAQFEIIPGLNGTNKIVLARISDFHLGVDGMSDADKAILKYSMETEQWYVDFHFAVGIALVNSSEIGVASVA